MSNHYDGGRYQQQPSSSDYYYDEQSRQRPQDHQQPSSSYMTSPLSSPPPTQPSQRSQATAQSPAHRSPYLDSTPSQSSSHSSSNNPAVGGGRTGRNVSYTRGPSFAAPPAGQRSNAGISQGGAMNVGGHPSSEPVVPEGSSAYAGTSATAYHPRQGSTATALDLGGAWSETERRAPYGMTSDSHAAYLNGGPTQDSEFVRGAPGTNTFASRDTKGTERSNSVRKPSAWEILVPSRWAAVFLSIIVVEAIVVITMVSIVFALIEKRVDDDNNQELKTVPVYLSIFVLGMVFELLIAVDAARLKNTIQCIGVAIFNIALLVTAALEITQVRDALQIQDDKYGGIPCVGRPNRSCKAITSLYPLIEKLLIVVPCVVGAAQIPISALVFKLHSDFGWLIYRQLGADLRVRRMHLWYEIFVVFLKLDLFLGAGFTTAYLILVADRNNWTFGVTIAAIPLAVAALVLAAYSVRKENRPLMLCSIVLFLAGGCYFIWKITRIYAPSTEDLYQTTRLTLTWFSIFSTVSLLLTIVNALICYRNFGNGLKEAHATLPGTVGSLSRRRFIRGGTGASAKAPVAGRLGHAIDLDDDDMHGVQMDNAGHSHPLSHTAPMNDSRLSLD